MSSDSNEIDFSELSAREQALICRLAVDPFNHRAAGLAAGYSGDHVENTVTNVLRRPHVRKAYTALRKQLAELEMVEAAQLIREWGTIAFSDINLISIDDQGNLVVPPGYEHLTRAIAQKDIQVRIHTDKDGNTTREIRAKIRMHSKTEALNQLAERTGLFEKPTDGSYKPPVLIIAGADIDVVLGRKPATTPDALPGPPADIVVPATGVRELDVKRVIGSKPDERESDGPAESV